MTWQRWVMLLLVSLAVLAGCEGGNPVPPPATAIGWFTISPNPVTPGAVINLSWRAVHVGLFEGEPYCTLQRILASSTPDAAVQVDCDDTIAVTTPSQETAITYRFSALKRDSETYVTRDVTVTVQAPAPALIDIISYELNPASPASLPFSPEGTPCPSEGRVVISGEYEKSVGDPVPILARPFTQGAPTPNYAASGSIQHVDLTGRFGQYFCVQEDVIADRTVDQIRLHVERPGTGELLFEEFVDVDYLFARFVP